MPIEQYRKDGRIIRGLQRGAASFGTSTASAALELSNRLVQAIQVYTCTDRYTYMCGYTLIHNKHVQVHTCACIHKHSRNMKINIHVCMYVHVHLPMHIQVPTCILARVHAHTPAHTA